MLPSKRGYDRAFDIAVGFKGGFERRRLAGKMLSVYCSGQSSPLHSNASTASPPIDNARMLVSWNSPIIYLSSLQWPFTREARGHEAGGRRTRVRMCSLLYNTLPHPIGRCLRFQNGSSRRTQGLISMYQTNMIMPEIATRLIPRFSFPPSSHCIPHKCSVYG